MRVFRARSNVGGPCRCPDCQAAGVTHLLRVRVPPDDFCRVPRWLHGEELRAWHDARARELAAMRAAVTRSKEAD